MLREKNITSRGGSRTDTTSKTEHFVMMKPLTIIKKRSILDVAVALDRPLTSYAPSMRQFEGNFFNWNIWK